MRLDEYARYDAIGLAELIRHGDISGMELALLAYQGIEKLNPILNFMAHIIPRQELEYTATDSHRPFGGVPFFTKEGNVAMKGQPWNMASRLGVGITSDDDDELLKRFRRAGLTIMGQSTAPEWGNAATTESVLHGPTLNPWNPAHMTGGSSGGAAAAVASGVIPIAHASDAGGSTRIPASCCGLVGLKTTRGRTPGSQDKIFALAVNDVLSRSVRDSALMLDCLHGPEVGDTYYVAPPERPYIEELAIPPKPLKIAYTTRSPSGATVDADCVEGVELALRACEAMGHHIEERILPYDWESLIAANLDLYAFGHPYRVAMAEQATSRKSGVETRETCNLAMLEYAKQITMLDFARHMNDRYQICVNMGQFFSEYDIFVSPVTNCSALPIGEMNANKPGLTATSWFDQILANYASFTPVYNTTGQPAISLPLYHSEVGLPIGVQFASRHGDEAILIRLASQLEEAMPWQQRKPPISLFE